MWAIIGGSGFEKFSEFKEIEKLEQQTPFGECSSGFKKVRLQDAEILFLPRHGARHELIPSQVNYQANIFALKKYGATKLLSFSAVGSLSHPLKPGDMVVPTQFIDRTKSTRKQSFCQKGLVAHVSLAKPVSDFLVDTLHEMEGHFDFDCHFDKTCVCIEGPHFSTQAESKWYRQMGADIIGMTAYPEYALAREAGICYLPCSFVTDYDCWDEDIEHVTVETVIELMKENNQRAFSIAKAIIPQTNHLLEKGCADQGIGASLFTDPKNITADVQEWLDVLL